MRQFAIRIIFVHSLQFTASLGMFSYISEYLWGQQENENDDSKHVTDTDDSTESDDDWVMVEGIAPAPGNLAVVYPLSDVVTIANIVTEAAEDMFDDETETEDVEEHNDLNIRQDLFKNTNIVERKGKYCAKYLTRKSLERSNKCFAVDGNKKKVARNTFQMKIPKSKKNYIK